MPLPPVAITVAQDSTLGDRIQALLEAVWPPALQATQPAGAYLPIDWIGIYRRWPEFQFGFFEADSGRLLAAANAVPLFLEGGTSDLPDAGWDWAIFTATAQHEAGAQPNLLCALSIAVDPEAYSQEWNGAVLGILRKCTAETGFARLIVPVRPAWKSLYPLIPMATYAAWTAGDGLPFDPELRTHVYAGGTIAKPCLRSLSRQAPVASWEACTGLTLPGSGHYIVPQLLAPLQVNHGADRGLYVEPNIWVEHAMDR